MLKFCHQSDVEVSTPSGLHWDTCSWSALGHVQLRCVVIPSVNFRFCHFVRHCPVFSLSAKFLSCNFSAPSWKYTVGLHWDSPSADHCDQYMVTIGTVM